MMQRFSDQLIIVIVDNGLLLYGGDRSFSRVMGLRN